MEFWELYDRHHARVRAYAVSMLRDAAAGDDAVQETFLRAQTHLTSLRELDKAAAWLLRIAHNICLDQLRATRAARVDPDAETDAALASEADSVEHELERAEMTACVRAQIDRLPEAPRAVILLYDILGLSHHDVASVLGVDVGAAKVRLHRARRKLRALLEGACSFDHDTHDVLVCEPKGPRR